MSLGFAQMMACWLQNSLWCWLFPEQLGWMSILKELTQNISHCLPTDCPFNGVSISSCNFFLVPAECLCMVPSLLCDPNWCQTTDLCQTTQHSPDNARFVLPCRIPLAMYCWHALGLANYFSPSPEITAQALSLYQENRRRQKNVTLKFRCQVQ